MIEGIYILESAGPVIFYSMNSSNIQLIKTLFPKLHIVARGNVTKVIGDENGSELFLKEIREVEKYCKEFNSFSEDAILNIIKKKGPTVVKQESLIIHDMNGKPITARTENRQLLIEAFENNDLVFATGPAGSGRTFAAIVLAVRALKNKEVRKIILGRPAVEAGGELSFLSGEMKDKLDPHLQPFYDTLQDMIPATKLKEHMKNNMIQIAPLAFMYGHTLSDTVIILDGAQNTMTHQIRMFLTCLGTDIKMIVAGDVTQIDLPPFTTSGSIQAVQILGGVNGTGKIEFTKKDIVQHEPVRRIAEAYDKFDDKREEEVKEAREKKTNINNN